MAASAWAQDVPVNREKYPDYVDPAKTWAPDSRLIKYVQDNMHAGSRSQVGVYTGKGLPDHWNNAETKHFPPVFNQAGGSCGSASRISYMFTHEINSLRDADASLLENQYPSHFVWLFTSGNDGKEAFVENIGVPNVVMYGGRTYSELFGYQEDTNNDFGWMTGYDRWMNAIGNRMTAPTFVPYSLDTKEGQLAAKAWLYNHAGDTDFKSGGLIGLGVASGGNWQRIPKSSANDAAGVTNMYYVHRWGTQVDHAVTMVGYDDRIEFDLDGDGKVGEEGEVGAWIIVNSWGDWCNKGFIYCPYAYAGPVSNQTTGAMTGGYWTGELYHARKNFRPLRAIKLKMDYTHRSELLLQVGISTDLDATEPESVVDMHHFRYAGDGNNGNTSPAPRIPMLGSWQGKLNHSPMELMYDVTDFSATFDQNKPLKYFFIINRKKSTNAGTGNIYEASIVDMDADREGVESLFDLGGEKFEITKDGKQLMVSTIVYGKGYNSINNLALIDGVLSWTAPNKGNYKVASYNIYREGTLVGNTGEMTYTVEGGQVYAVTAVYEDGTESEPVSVVAPTAKNTTAIALEGAGFTIPEVFSKTYRECTIEFWIKPTRFADWNNQAGPNWGQYLQHFNSNGTFTFGWDTGNRNTSKPFTLNTWEHVAIVVAGNKMTMYKGMDMNGSVTSTTYSGLGGFGDFVFRSGSEGEWQNAEYDEIRIWDYARTKQQICQNVNRMKQEFHGDVLPQGLIAYYKGDTFKGEDGTYYMREYVNGYHAPIHRVTTDPQKESSLKVVNTNSPASLSIDAPDAVHAGQPVTLTATRGDGINRMWWDIPSCNTEKIHAISPTVTFTAPGTYQVVASGLNYSSKQFSDTLQLEVLAAAELDATFTLGSTTVACGEHFSMHANTYTEACSYEWSLPGALKETVLGAKAGATYVVAGEFTVTLKVTAADGRTAQSSRTITVNDVSPVADFYVTEPVVMKETPVTLSSTSLYTPTYYNWVLDGQAQKTTITEGQAVQTWTPKYPGRYDISLTAGNHVGENTITKSRALIVTNAESGSGLSFSQPSAQVAIPNDTDLGAFTIEFWANPSSLEEACWGIGKDKSTLLLVTDENGRMTLYVNGKAYSSLDGYVEAGVWNHYTISRSIMGVGRVTFLRNGSTDRAHNNANIGTVKAAELPTITLGVETLPITGSIDEFRLWTGNQISKVVELNNQPLENPETYSSLLVYYDFNQTGGDVIDRTGNGRTGVRTGFGPDGDAWGASKGVFSLYHGDKLNDEVVTGVDEVLPSEPVAAGRTGVYTLSGQYVGRTIQGLPAGLYIVDGRKVAVR